MARKTELGTWRHIRRVTRGGGEFKLISAAKAIDQGWLRRVREESPLLGLELFKRDGDYYLRRTTP